MGVVYGGNVNLRNNKVKFIKQTVKKKVEENLLK